MNKKETIQVIVDYEITYSTKREKYDCIAMLKALPSGNVELNTKEGQCKVERKKVKVLKGAMSNGG